MPEGLSRYPLLLVAMATLILGGLLGLARMGWQMPLIGSHTIAHGPLMISGFLGTLIAVERAVALQTPAAYIGPALSALGAIVMVAGIPFAPQILFTLASVALVFVFAYIVRSHTALYTIVMALGAVCWLVGNGLWLAGIQTFLAVHWWVAFLVLTVAGERLELSRVTRLTVSSQRLFGGVMILILVGLGFTVLIPDIGIRLVGVGYVLLAVWLLHYDIARRTVRKAGLSRYIAVCLLTGYVWLAGGGAAMLGYGFSPAGLPYDAMLHAVLIGFIMAMIFGHAPIIMPALLNTRISYHPALYTPLILLHLTMILRFAADIGGAFVLRQWGGLGNGLAIVLFAGVMVSGMWLSQRADRHPTLA